MQTTIGDLIEWSAKNHPNKIGLIYDYKEKHHRFTFLEIDARVNRFSQALLSLGVEKGDVVSAFLYNTSEFFISLFSCAKIGAIFNPINYRLSPHELQFILQDANAKVLIYEEMGSDIVEKALRLDHNVTHRIYVDGKRTGTLSFDDLLAQHPAKKPTVSVHEDDPYIMMYTSGTTGRPKGVIHTHRNKITHNFLMMQTMLLTKNDIGLSCAPLNHTAELHTSFLPRVHVGATNVLLHHFDARRVLEIIETEKITHFFAAPTMINMILNAPSFRDFDVSSLRLVEYGGASMAPILIRDFLKKTGAELVQIFGTTEMGPCMTVLHADEQLKKAGAAGKAVLLHEARIARIREDEPSHPDDQCHPYEVGEILIKGPCVMNGYHNRKDATDKALAHGWYHTGDLGMIDHEGFIWIRDRIDHMILSGAENISPREIEDLLMEHPDINEVAVIGEPDPKWGEIVVAYVVLKHNKKLESSVFDQFLIQSEKLAPFKRPRKYYFVDDLPKTASGKIQKFVLEKS